MKTFTMLLAGALATLTIAPAAQAAQSPRRLRADILCLGKDRQIRLGWDLTIAIVKKCTEGCPMDVHNLEVLGRRGFLGQNLVVRIPGVDDAGQSLTIRKFLSLSASPSRPMRGYRSEKQDGKTRVLEEFGCFYLP